VKQTTETVLIAFLHRVPDDVEMLQRFSLLVVYDVKKYVVFRRAFVRRLRILRIKKQRRECRRDSTTYCLLVKESLVLMIPSLNSL
jgi:hypothetical protein